MKKLSVILLSGALLASASAPTFAEGGPSNGSQENGQEQIKIPQNQNGSQRDGNAQQGGQHNGNPQGGPKGQTAHHQGKAQSSPQQRQANNGRPQGDHNFRKGHRLPSKYRGQGYQVNDWRARGLQAPPQGHRWVRVNNDYILIAVATGVIGSIIAHQ